LNGRNALDIIAILECDDLSSLSGGGLSPSSALLREHGRASRLVVFRAAFRGATWVTSHPSGQSGDESPQSMEAPNWRWYKKRKSLEEVLPYLALFLSRNMAIQ
jgi:hypothetical protein